MTAKKKLIICRGIPGAGKSTWLRTTAPEAVVCSADDFFMVDGKYQYDRLKIGEAHEACWVKFEAAMRGDEPLVALDNVSHRNAHLQPYVSLDLVHGYEVEIHTFRISVNAAAARNTHGVPHRHIHRLAGSTEELPPEWKKFETIHESGL